MLSQTIKTETIDGERQVNVDISRLDDQFTCSFKGVYKGEVLVNTTLTVTVKDNQSPVGRFITDQGELFEALVKQRENPQDVIPTQTTDPIS